MICMFGNKNAIKLNLIIINVGNSRHIQSIFSFKPYSEQWHVTACS